MLESGELGVEQLLRHGSVGRAKQRRAAEIVAVGTGKGLQHTVYCLDWGGGERSELLRAEVLSIGHTVWIADIVEEAGNLG